MKEGLGGPPKLLGLKWLNLLTPRTLSQDCSPCGQFPSCSALLPRPAPTNGRERAKRWRCHGFLLDSLELPLFQTTVENRCVTI